AGENTTPDFGAKLNNNSKKPSGDGVKRSSAGPKEERSNKKDRLKNGGGKASNTARLRDSVINMSRHRTNPKSMIGGACSKSRPLPARMKFVMPTAAR